MNITVTPISEEMVLENESQVSALAHPLRIRVLKILFEQQATNKQLAQALGESPARLHFHVQELLKAGLIQLVEERPKRGVIEKYYRAVARGFRLAPNLATGTGIHREMALITWEAAREDLVRAFDFYGGPPPRLRSGQYQVLLPADAAARILEHLNQIEAEFQAAEGREPATSVPEPTSNRVAFSYLFHFMPFNDDTRPTTDATAPE